MRSDILFFLGVFVFLFVAWVATGGPEKPISFAGPFITPITDAGEEQRGYGSFWEGGAADDNWWDWSWDSDPNSAQKEIWKAQDELSDLQRDLQDARLFGNPSVYKDVVSISGSGPSLASADEDEEYVTISVSSRAEGAINMDGWRLVSVRTKESAALPKAAAVFRSGSVNQTAPLTLSPGERAIVVTGRSPVGVSFRENACSGYLADRQDFKPSLAASCPAPMDDFERFYNGGARDYQSCKDRVAQVERCSTSGRSGTSGSCGEFMREHFTYNGCMTYHAADRNFWSKTWRVYLGEREDLWPERNETIKLLDSQGNTVDLISY